jgi:hypothetical protein
MQTAIDIVTERIKTIRHNDKVIYEKGMQKEIWDFLAEFFQTLIVISPLGWSGDLSPVKEFSVFAKISNTGVAIRYVTAPTVSDKPDQVYNFLINDSHGLTDFRERLRILFISWVNSFETLTMWDGVKG